MYVECIVSVMSVHPIKDLFFKDTAKVFISHFRLMTTQGCLNENAGVKITSRKIIQTPPSYNGHNKTLAYSEGKLTISSHALYV